MGDGYYVTAVVTARQAMAAVRNREFELVVLDFSLPDGDGLEITRQIRCEIPLLPILAISGFMMGDMPREAVAAGASATLPKPTTSSALRRSVSELLAHADSGVQRYKIAGA
jgi:CheY-like chemotaxis protein